MLCPSEACVCIICSTSFVGKLIFHMSYGVNPFAMACWPPRHQICAVRLPLINRWRHAKMRRREGSSTKSGRRRWRAFWQSRYRVGSAAVLHCNNLSTLRQCSLQCNAVQYCNTTYQAATAIAWTHYMIVAHTNVQPTTYTDPQGNATSAWAVQPSAIYSYSCSAL